MLGKRSLRVRSLDDPARPRVRVRLFTTAYPESDPARRAEYAECLIRNLACPAIDEICVLVEDDVPGLPDDPRFHTWPVDRRPTYDDFFAWMREVAGPDDVSVLANTDVWFGRQLELFRRWPMPADEAWALSRWDAGPPLVLYDRKDSQDAWVLRGPPRPIAGAFPLGVPRCDNRIAAELVAAGYRLRNPARSVQALHVHDAPVRPYLEPEHSRAIPPPYRYEWPTNLWSWPRTALYNARYPQAALAYRFDTRRWSPLRAVRRARFHLGALRRLLLPAGE